MQTKWNILHSCFVLLVLLLASSGAARDPQPPVADSEVCILEISTDSRAAIVIDQRDYGLQRTFRFPIDVGRRYVASVTVHFAEGSAETHRVFLERDRRIRLALPSPSARIPELVAQTGHSTVLTKAAFSTDNRYVVTVSADRQAIIWECETGQQLRSLQHSDSATDATFSSDGRHLLVADRSGVVTLWETVTGREVRRFAGEKRGWCARISPDSRHVLIAGDSVVLRDLQTGILKQTLQSEAKITSSADFSPDGERLVTGGDDHLVRIFDVSTGDERQVLRGHSSPIHSVAFSADGQSVVSTEMYESVTILWDAGTGKRRQTYKVPGSARSAVISPDGKYVLTSSSDPWMNRSGDDFAILWNAFSGEEIRRFYGHSHSIESVAFSSDGSRALTASSDNTAALWETSTGNLIRRFGGDTSVVSSMDINGEARLLTGSLNGVVSVWDMKAGSLERTLRGNSGQVLSVHFSPEGTMALTGSYGVPAEIDSESGKANVSGRKNDRRQNNLLGIADQLRSEGIIPPNIAGLDVITGTDDASQEVNESSILWDLNSGRQMRHFAGQYSRFSPDGRLVLTGDSGGSQVAIWDRQTGRRERTLSYPMAKVVLYSPDGRRILTTGGWTSDTVTIWEASSGRDVVRLTGHSKRISAAAFSRDGRHVVTASSDNSAALWDTSNGRRIRQFTGHKEAVESIAVSPDGGHFATGSMDQTAKLWHIDGQLLRTLETQGGTVGSVAFSPSGRELLTASFDGMVRIWDVNTGVELIRLLSIGDDWLVVTPDGLFDGSYGGRQKVMFRIGEGLNVVPVDRFFQDLYYPGLLAAIWRGERPMPQIHIGDALPPSLAIDTPQLGGDVGDQHVTVTVTATDKGGGIKGPSIRHNGATLIGAVRTTERIEGAVRRTFAVNLIEGENTLEATSASADGSFESEPARIVLQYNRPLAKSRLHLLAVGIDDYADESLKMKYAVSDANDIASVFASRGGSLYEEVLVTPLENETATRDAILKGIQSLAANSSPQDTAVVFLSGHGTMVDERFYFIPQDFHRASDSLHEDLRKSALAAADLGEALAQVPALKRMIVFDTGQSGQALPVQKLTRNPFAFRGAVERLSRAQGAFTIASAAVSDKAVEVDELRHGVLSYSFLAGLKAVEIGPLVNEWVQPVQGENVAQALDLFSFTSSRSRQLGHRYFGQEQDVQYSSSGMSFPVLPVDGTLRTDSTAMAAAGDRQLRYIVPAVPSIVRPSGGAEGNGTLHVITIGISEYSESSMNLKYAASDAKSIGELLQSRHAALFDDVRVTTLLNDRATRQEILNAVSQVAEAAEAGDTLAVFLAGHGAMVGQRYYFIPADFENSSGESTDTVVRTMGLAADELGDAISQITVSRRILVFDTCASGGAIHLSKQGSDPFAFRSAIEQIGKGGGTFTLAAVGSSEVAQEVDELQHGVLSYCLLAGAGAIEFGPLADRPLQSASADSVDVLEWFSYAAGHVPRLTSQYFHQEQQAQLGGTGKSFGIFSRQRATAKIEE